MENNIKIPTEEECYSIIKKHNMLANIIEHSKQVMRVSVALVDNLIDSTIVNRELIIAAALLHDIAKTETLKSGELRHDRMGAKIMADLGYNEIAEIVDSHVIFESFSPGGKLEEREIIHYADKRVMHNRIVTIDERINDIQERYGKYIKDKEILIQRKLLIKEIEKKIQGFLFSDITSILAGI
ncbi:HD domain-containing protein [Spirochaetota bacterium]